MPGTVTIPHALSLLISTIRWGPHCHYLNLVSEEMRFGEVSPCAEFLGWRPHYQVFEKPDEQRL